MPSRPRPTEAVYTAAQLPEILRSALIAGIITRFLEDAAGDGQDTEGRPIPEPVQAVLKTTAQEIRDWHTAKPRPADLNGGA